MEEKRLTRNILLQSDQLDGNLFENIKKKVMSEYEGKCSKNDGYIVKILEFLTISGGKIVNGCAPLFTVDFKAQILKPEKGKIIKCKTQMIYNHGIFAGFNDLKIIIPKSFLHDYSFGTGKEDSFYIKKGEKICVGDDIEIKITDLQYEKKNFSCVGKLINKL